MVYHTVIFLYIINSAHAQLRANVFKKPIFRPMKESKQSLRVYDGIVDYNNEYSYVVALGGMKTGDQQEIPTFSQFCTGSLVSPRWVLSAHHCVRNGGPNDKLSHIRYGNTTIPEDDRSFSYSRVSKRISKEQADIGLILLHEKDKVSLPTYGILSAVDYKTLAGLTVKYVGYGFTEMPGQGKLNKTKNRRIGDALVVPCEHYMKTLYKLSFRFRIVFAEPLICIVPKCSQKLAAASPGDSGGPMLRRGRIVAVTTAGFSNYIPSDTFTPISPHIDWILSVMSLNQ